MICVTGTCSEAMRSASRRPLHVALQHAGADAVEPTQGCSSSVVLPAPGAAHQVDDRDPGAVEVGPVRRRDRPVGVEDVLEHLHVRAMHASSSTSIDSTSNSSPRRDRDVAAAQAGHRNGGWSQLPLVPAVGAAQSAGTISSSSRAPSQTVPRETMPKQNSSDSGTTCRRRPTRTRTAELPAVRPRGAPPCRRSRWRATSSCISAAATSAIVDRRARPPGRPPPATAGAQADAHLLDLRRLAGDDHHLARASRPRS